MSHKKLFIFGILALLLIVLVYVFINFPLEQKKKNQKYSVADALAEPDSPFVLKEVELVGRISDFQNTSNLVYGESYYFNLIDNNNSIPVNYFDDDNIFKLRSDAIGNKEFDKNKIKLSPLENNDLVIVKGFLINNERPTSYPTTPYKLIEAYSVEKIN